MNRMLAVVALLLLLSAGAAGVWAAAQPPVGLLLVPGASDVRITRLGWNEWQISYRVPGAAPWPSTVGRQLQAAGWAIERPAKYGALSRTYNHATGLGIGELWEWAYLTVDPVHPDLVRMMLRRSVHLPWLGINLPYPAH